MMKGKQRVVHTEYNLFEMNLDKQDETKRGLYAFC